MRNHGLRRQSGEGAQVKVAVADQVASPSRIAPPLILVFLIAANELTVSALLWSAGTQTLGVAIFNLDDSGSSDLASALSVLVVVMVIGLMAALEFLAKYLPEGVLPWRN